MRLLIVDDNALIAQSLAEILHVQGHECLAALSAADALAVLPGFAPEAVVLDVFLPPGPDGLSVLQAMRGPLGMATVPVVVATVKGETSRLQEGPYTRTVRKPYTVEEVIAAVAQMVEAQP